MCGCVAQDYVDEAAEAGLVNVVRDGETIVSV